MSKANIGIDVDDLGLPTKEGLRRSAVLGFRTVEFGAAGEVDPSNLSSSGRRHLLRYVEGLGLGMAALRADLPGLRLIDGRTVDERVERTCRIFQLARDLNVGIVTASVEALTDPAAEGGEDVSSRTPSPLAVEALRRLGETADTLGIVYALRPSQDEGDSMACLMEELGCPSIGICLDPAAMVMCGANPLSIIQRLPDQVVLFHARDGTAGIGERTGRETRLGEGEVDLLGVLTLLSAVEYTGPYILRRTDSADPASDLQNARDTLVRLLPPG